MTVDALSAERQSDRDMVDALREVLGLDPLYKGNDSSPTEPIYYHSAYFNQDGGRTRHRIGSK